MRKLRTGFVLAALLLVGCIGNGNGITDLQDANEVAASTGEAMASLDEGLEGGGFAALTPPGRKPQRLWSEFLGIGSAHAATCGAAATFQACAAGVRLRTFNSCNFGEAVIDGSTSLAFSSLTCTLPVGGTVTRNTSFSISTARGLTMSVSSEGGGQTITRTGEDTFTYHVAGIRRTLRSGTDASLFDISTKTTGDVTVTGSSRANRVMTGGSFEITHHLAGYVTSLTPTDLTWTQSCTCATSGKLEGNATKSEADGGSKTFTLELTGCGTGNLTVGSKTIQVTLDRCGGTV